MNSLILWFLNVRRVLFVQVCVDLAVDERAVV